MTIDKWIATRLKALLLVLMAIFFAQKFWSGQLYYYIGPRFGWLAPVAVGLLIVMAGAYRLVQEGGDEDNHHGHGHFHDHGDRVSAWPLIIVALPIFLGVVVPARPLGASAVSNRGISTEVALAAEDTNTVLTVIPGERNVLDWVRMMNTDSSPDALNGQEANIVGFVYRDTRFGEDQFMVGRFTLTCCVADALAIGVVVQAESADHYATDSWVRVRGVFSEGMLEGDQLPVLKAEEITPVQQPEQPYLYP